jgi:two-component system, OmpR family, phosphate regulon sensor histidine kinase PhoR
LPLSESKNDESLSSMAKPKAVEPDLSGSEQPAPATAPVSPASTRDGGRDPADWIAEVSHELRLPIANIKLLVETLLDGAIDDQVTARRMLTRAKTEVDRLQSLVVDLLTVEQVAASRKEVHCQWIYLQAKAAYAIESTRKMAQEKRVRITTEIEHGYRIYANSEMIDQVLLNLLENAIKFTPASGLVVVRSGPVAGALSIEDTGIGMPAHEIPKIFQRFYRIDRAQSRGSTGLGLSIVKHIADLHGAKINVTSQEGKGTVFSLEFPNPK